MSGDARTTRLTLLREQGGNPVRIAVYAKPGSSSTRVGGTYRDALLIRVTATATDGRATQAVLKALAKSLGVPQKCITLFGGGRSRNKILDISPPPGRAEAVAKRIKELRDA
jgi:uncharacterized protein YggU (UPF0235/DUF167 family)